MKARFDNSKDFRGLIIQSQKGSYGLNLQAANYLFIYESPISVLDRTQLERRERRQGQKYTVFQYDLLMRNTADEAILRFHREGKSLYKNLVTDPESIIK
jgi:SNF2 family DNA or RNA helicase